MSKKEPNHYVLAVFTAFLSGILSLIGFYLSAKLQAENRIAQKQYENRARSYEYLLNNMSMHKFPAIVGILNVGNLVEHVATDGEIQALEDTFEKLSLINNYYKVSWQLDNHFNILRLYGSESVVRYCEDILAVLALREFTVDWNSYPSEVQEFRSIWVRVQENGVAYGWEEKVTNEERIMFALASILYRNLITQLRNELKKGNA